MRSLQSLGRAHASHRRGRAFMSAAGIILGVAMYVAAQGGNVGLNRAFDEQFLSRIGDTDVQVIPVGDNQAVLPAAAIAQVAALPDVVAVSAVLDVPATKTSGETVQFRGVDERWPELLTFEAADGRLPTPGAAEVVVNKGSGLGAGDTLAMFTPAGERQFAVVGVLTERGQGDVDDEDAIVAFTSLAVAQSVAQRGEVVASIWADLGDVDVDVWLDEHEKDLQGADIREAGGTFSLGAFTLGMQVISYLCLFIGAYLIYVTMSSVIAERTSEIGTLRALGAKRKQIRKMLRAEAIWMSTIGGIAGIVLGTFLGFVLTKIFGAMVDLETSFVFPFGGAVTGFVIGLLVTLVGVLGPSRRAARLSPIVAMRGDVQQRARTGRGWIAGVVLVPLGLVTMSSGDSPFSVVLFMAGAVLLVPPLFAPLARVAGAVTSRLAPGIGRLTMLQAIREKARSAGTLGVVMVVLGFAMGMIMTTNAMKDGRDAQLDRQLQTDVELVVPGGISPGAFELARTTPGIDRISENRCCGQATLANGDDDRDVMLTILDPATYRSVFDLDLSEGNLDEVHQALAAGGAVVLPELVAESLDLEAGDEATLVTTAGAKPFRVVALSRPGGGPLANSAILGLGDGRAHFGAGLPSGLLMDVAEGTDPETVSNELRRRFHGETGFGGIGDRSARVLTSNDIREAVVSQSNTQLNTFLAVSGVASLVALLGMANTLGLSVLQRRREFGLLRAVGARRRQISRSVLSESALLSSVAFLLALPLGMVIGYSFTSGAETWVGVDVEVRPPVGPVVILAVLAVLVALFAAWRPARRAGRLAIVDALRFD